MPIDTTYVDFKEPVVDAAWLNNVNNVVNYHKPTASLPLNGNELVSIQQAGVSKQLLLSEISGFEYIVNVLDPKWGVKGDGVTDDTTALQACFNTNQGQAIYIPGTDAGYKVTSLIHPENTFIFGGGARYEPGTKTTKIIGTPGYDVWTFSGAGMFPAGHRLENVYIDGGLNGLCTPNDKLIIRPIVKGITVSGQTNASLYVGLGTEAFYMSEWEMGAGSKYAIFTRNAGGIPGNYFIAQLTNGRVNGETGFRFEHSLGARGSVFKAVAFQVTSKNAVDYFAPDTSPVFQSCTWEGTGYAPGGDSVSGTTVSCVGTALVLTAPLSVSNGQDITIENAGIGLYGLQGADFTTTVASGGGTANITLSDPAPISVGAGAMVIGNAPYFGVTFGDGTGFGNLIPVDVVFRDCDLGAGIGSGRSRYGLNNQVGTFVTLESCAMSQVYDPFGAVTLMGRNTGTIRRATQAQTFANFRGVDGTYGGALRAYAPMPAAAVGVPGSGYDIRLTGYDGTPFGTLSSGVFSNFRVVKTDVNPGDNKPTSLFQVNGDTEAVEFVRKVTYNNTDKQVFLTGGTYNFPDYGLKVQNKAPATIATYTVNLPVNPVDNQIVFLATRKAITALTIGASHTINNTITTLPDGGTAAWQYDAGTTSWEKA